MTHTVYLPLVTNGKGNEEMTVLGIDVSKWQDNNSTAQQMDFTKSVAQGAKFVFIKSSQALWTDEDILYNWKSAKTAGLMRGAYHFLDWVANPRKQAQYAWSIIQNDPGELPPVVDFEYWNPPPPKAYDILWNYVVEMEKLCGRKPIIYTGAFFWAQHGTTAAVWKNYPLWIASYSNKEYMEGNVAKLTPWDNWHFWQYTDKGDGIAFGAESKQLDMNYFNGSLNDLKRFSGIDVTVPVPTPEPTPEPPTPPTVGVIEFEVLTDTLNVCSGPGTTYPVIGKLSKGATVIALDFGGSSCWLKTEAGWCAVDFQGIRYMQWKK